MRWSVVVPVKGLDAAKSRLRGPRAGHERAGLARAFVTDCVDALIRASDVHEVTVVSADPAVRILAEECGARWLAEPEPAGLNAAAAFGVAGCTGPVAVVVGDLPSLTPAAVDLVLRIAAGAPRSFVSDAGGTGTTMLLAHDPAECRPMFGARSRARHAASGSIDLGLDLPGSADLARARRDVDTEVDLADAIRLGVGAATRAALGLR